MDYRNEAADFFERAQEAAGTSYEMEWNDLKARLDAHLAIKVKGEGWLAEGERLMDELTALDARLPPQSPE